MIAARGAFTLSGSNVNFRRHLKAKVTPGVFYLSHNSVSLVKMKGKLTAGTGSFSLSGIAVSLKVKRKISPVAAEFLLLGGYIAPIKPNQISYLLDDLAEDAIPAQSFFVPTMRWSQPTEVLSLDATFGEGSGHVYTTIYTDYYDQATNTWKDDQYEEQNPGVPIPVSLKAQVADQLYLYNVYLVRNAEWQAEYQREFILQWPYYYAAQVLARR